MMSWTAISDNLKNEDYPSPRGGPWASGRKQAISSLYDATFFPKMLTWEAAHYRRMSPGCTRPVINCSSSSVARWVFCLTGSRR